MTKWYFIAGWLRPCLLLMCCVFGAGGCGYTLSGMVVSGPTNAVVVSDRDQEPGEAVAGAVVDFTIDPRSLSPKHVGAVLTDSQGRFTIGVKEFGAGFLEYELGVVSRANGFRSTRRVIGLPGSNHRIVIVMEPGVDKDSERTDPIEESLRLGGYPSGRW